LAFKASCLNFNQMKNVPLLLLTLFLLSAMSCTMEKRLYRNGWYSEHSKKIIHTENQPGAAIENQDAALTGHPAADTNSPFTVRVDTTIQSSFSIPVKVSAAEKTDDKVQNDPPSHRMTYAEAVAAMAKKGCKPHKFAATVHFLSLLSIATCWFAFLSLPLVLTTLVLCHFATAKVVADANCVDENLAIIKSAQRNCLIYLTVLLAVTALFVGLMFYIINYTNWIY
jgi:hypothetical protein